MYDHKSIEAKWQKIWEEKKLFKADDKDETKPKYYALDMFPYPSGAGLHVGHPEGYTATDIVSRYKRMNGYNVLHPMGWDAFGLPAENYAIKMGTPPEETTNKNIETFTKQVKSLGFSYDWEREINTSSPEYYKWTQWFFLFLYKNGLAYKKNAPVNWCNGCQTVLANEQVVDGECERCQSEVIQKKMNQWFFKITDFIENSGGNPLSKKEEKTKKVLLIHCFEGNSETAWQPWVAEKLRKQGFDVRVPNLPNSSHPDFAETMSFLQKETEDFTEDDIIIGHSLGAYFAVKLSEQKNFGKIILVGPSLTGNVKKEKEESARSNGSDVEAPLKVIADGGKIELNKIQAKQKFAFFSTNDEWIFIEDTKVLKPDFQINILKNRGHFTDRDFLELFEVIGKTEKNVTSGLLSGLDKIDWPDSTKISQRNWIGKSEGAEVDFRIVSLEGDTEGVKSQEKQTPPNPLKGDFNTLRVFTTRPDTLFGATYMVLAPEHSLVSEITTEEQKQEVEEYVQTAIKKTELERREGEKEKTGVFTGGYAINPVNEEKIPVWIADYVMMGYGTGAIMAVPAHDKRDFEFAKIKELKIEHVLEPNYEKFQVNDFLITAPRKRENLDVKDSLIKTLKYQYDDLIKKGIKTNVFCFTGEGLSINSGFLDGLRTNEAKEKMINWLEEKGVGERKITYRLRDWLVSRQRFWGSPIPIIYCEDCGEVAVPEEDLPVKLPNDVDFKPTGESPLVNSKTFHDVVCPKCNKPARRESDTMDTFVCSSWYYLRFADSQNDQMFADKDLMNKWLPVDLYVGGAEHTVLHLLYSRFFTKALHKFGYINSDEPFQKLRHQGMILAEDGYKMSKSLGNVINPDDIVNQYGADTLRIYEMFMGPFDQAVSWNTKGTEGIYRFLQRINRVYEEIDFTKCDSKKGDCSDAPNGMPQLLHKTIKKVTEDIDNFRFNTAISQMMIFINFVTKEDKMPKPAAEIFLKLLSPFAPHLAEELWEKLGNSESIGKSAWPTYVEALTIDDEIELVIQVNGKLRDKFNVARDISKDDAIASAKDREKIQNFIEGKEIVKEIFVPGKLVNLVVK